MKLIVGLGNKGSQYDNTRHNVGFMFLDYLSNNFNFSYSENKKLKSELCKIKLENEEVIFLKPLTYMNLSGEAILKTANFYKIKKEDILVVVDDINLSLASVRIRQKGSSGGHNGLKNISLNLKGDDFLRIRIGVSKPNNNQDMVSFVLSKFGCEEIEKLKETFKELSNAILEYLRGDSISVVMTRYNKINA